jgi:F-type H+-transporting ATPase subunit b
MIGRPMFARLLAGTSLVCGAWALAAAPALAAEGGMPQLNFHDFAPQVVWLVITFGLLYIVMTKVALPVTGQVLEMRANRIKSDLDRATSLKAESDKVIATYEKALTDARNQAATVSRETANALAAQAAERQSKVGSALAERIKAAEAAVAEAKGKAMNEIRTVAADIAADATKRLVGMQVSAADASQAVTATLKDRG